MLACAIVKSDMGAVKAQNEKVAKFERFNMINHAPKMCLIAVGVVVIETWYIDKSDFFMLGIKAKHLVQLISSFLSTRLHVRRNFKR